MLKQTHAVSQNWQITALGAAILNIDEVSACNFGNKKPADLSISGPFCNPAASYFPTASQQQYHRPWRA